jgi:hypothetical protein
MERQALPAIQQLQMVHQSYLLISGVMLVLLHEALLE